MTVLIAGLVLFLLVHSVRVFADDWRARQVARLGARPFKLAYSALSLVALVLIVWGFGAARASPVVLWQAPPGARHVAALLTVIGFVLIVAAYYPGTRMKAAIGHPMTLGVALWALGHLISNGRAADVVLFGAFLVWSLALFAIRRRRDRAAGTAYPPGRGSRDAVAIVVGVVAALVFAFFLHGPLIGVRPFA